METKNLTKPLQINEIDFRVQSINKGGYATILAYKDARADMNRLDEVCGPMNWKREHTRDNQNCIVSLWDDAKKQWISKEEKLESGEFEIKDGRAKQTYKLNLRRWTWFSQWIDGGLQYLACKDDKNKLRFKYGEYKKQS
jgi:hypothetical protein